ncbi:sugar dehydrogenase [Leptospira semungkisensis]|uniref:Sugar dehydrogenase n=1 Tax=Leptospira semungkisensis TaxID=2484985 RepID=A0A4R9FMW8_9LEPT|nr:PQQ-dependent sugar dehydrogenase [Leptospira semungkisensis]TGJ99594.1 sugar dehydrogenase [Leptospira semungkisensis]
MVFRFQKSRFLPIGFLFAVLLLECKPPANSSLLPLLFLGESKCSESRVPSCLKTTEIASGFNAPLFVGAPNGDTSRLFVVEQGGKIRLIKNGALLSTPFLDIGSEGTDLIDYSGERGLLGLAFHPSYSSNGRFWVDYTRKSDGAIVLAEYSRSAGDQDQADPSPVKEVFNISKPFANHNGGMIAFGPDGFLYIATGDGGGAGDPNGNAQNVESSLGKILRIDVDSYPTPAPGNRPATGSENPHIWDWGLRNPWRFSFDRSSGDLYIADVGQNLYEELNIETSGQGLKNYGWKITEAKHCFSPSVGCSVTGITLPQLEYSHFSGKAITGGYVYRGTNLPDYAGRYFYGDFINQRVWSLIWDGTKIDNIIEHTQEMGFHSPLPSFGEDANGEVYIVDYNGRVLRIDAQ